MKISIIGAGAMGSLYGGMLSEAGHDVVLYDVNKEHVDRINSKGLAIHSAATKEVKVVHPSASTDPGAVRNSDIFIIFVKSTITEIVAKQFSEYANENTIVITLQNGLGNEAIIRRYFPEGQVAAGVTSQGATFIGPGEINHAGKGPTYLCMADKNNARLEPFVNALNSAGFETHIEENIEDLIWSKLIINVGINAVTAITGLENGKLLDYPEIKEVMADLVAEGVKTAEKKGVKFTYPDPLAVVFEVAEKTALNRSSMLQDFDRGNATEIDFINNAIVREAEKLGMEAPVNKTVTGIVKTLEKINRNRS